MASPNDGREKEKRHHIGQGYMKLCVNNNDDIVILNDLELDGNHGELDIVMSLCLQCIPDSMEAVI